MTGRLPAPAARRSGGVCFGAERVCYFSFNRLLGGKELMSGQANLNAEMHFSMAVGA